MCRVDNIVRAYVDVVVVSLVIVRVHRVYAYYDICERSVWRYHEVYVCLTDSILAVSKGVDIEPVDARIVYEVISYDRAIRLSWPAFGTPHVVEGAPSVEGPWTEVTEPVLQEGPINYMTIPAVFSDTIEVFRLRR